MLIRASASIYGDELITATELNRQPGRILDLAWERPVTITRNEQHFALLRRDRMTYIGNEELAIAFKDEFEELLLTQPISESATESA